MGGVYLSTGAFTGRVNGRDWRLLAEHAGELRADGFEWLLFEDYEDELEDIAARYRALALPVRAVHADKRIGDLLSEPEEEAYGRAEALFLRECAAAEVVGAEKLVLHGWGIPHSDAEPERLYARIGRLLGRGAGFAVDVCVENCACVHGSPLKHLTRLAEEHPGLGVVLDTRCAAFHDELERTCLSPLLAGNVRHIHVSDFRGAPGDFSALHPIRMPGEGIIDWPRLFDLLAGYEGSYTLESPAMLPEGVDARALNAGLDFIRAGIERAGRGAGGR